MSDLNFSWDELDDIDSAIADSVWNLRAAGEKQELDDEELEYIARIEAIRLRISERMAKLKSTGGF